MEEKEPTDEPSWKERRECAAAEEEKKVSVSCKGGFNKMSHGFHNLFDWNTKKVKSVACVWKDHILDQTTIPYVR